jgi:hypothetical protein
MTASRIHPRRTEVEVRAERLLAAADRAGVNLAEMENVRRRLVGREHERWTTPACPRRTELERLIFEDIETLCRDYLKLHAAANR